MSERKRIGVGVVSLGWMGRLHARGYRNVVERYPELGISAHLAAAADPVDAVRETAVDALGFESATPDYRELLADPAVDAVSICSPNFLHREIALAAVEAGKPFWIEKPMGISREQSREIATAAETAGLVTAVGFNYRQVPAIAHARSLVRSGALGRITNVRTWLIADYASSPSGPLTWRYSTEKAGSGVIGDLLSHGFDLAQFVVGRVREVTALTDTFITERPLPLEQGVGHAAVRVSSETGPVENEDYASVLARFDGGTVGTFEASRVANGPRAEYALEVYGTEGSIRWSFEHPQHLQVFRRGEGSHHGYVSVMDDASHGDFVRFQPGPGQTMSFDDLKTIEAKLFLESIVTGDQLAPSAADAWAAAEIDHAALHSAADGRWHPVEQVAGRVTYDA